VPQYALQPATKTSQLDPRGLQTSMPPPVGDSPPLLPAFLITGLLLSVICAIIAYRHYADRRIFRRPVHAEDPTWADEDLAIDPKAAPTLWEAEMDKKGITNGRDWRWDKIKPVSVKPIRNSPKHRRPRYLIPSDRPVTFWTRMFGPGAFEGYNFFGFTRPRGPISLSRQPGVSLVAPTNAGAQNLSHENEDETPESIDRLQVAVLIALPRRKRSRRTLKEPRQEADGYMGDAEKDGVKSELSVTKPQDGQKAKLEDEAKSPAHDHYDSDADDFEMSIGTIILPYAGEG